MMKLHEGHESLVTIVSRVYVLLVLEALVNSSDGSQCNDRVRRARQLGGHVQLEHVQVVLEQHYVQFLATLAAFVFDAQ